MPMSMPLHAASRRTFLRQASAGLALAGLGGCGFQLRQAPELPFTTIQLTGFTVTSPMADALRRSIASSTTTRVVESLPQAQVVLNALIDSHERGVSVTTSVGQVREIQVRARLKFTLNRADGRELIPPTEILQFRDMTYNERNALAKEQEEQNLYRAMQDDIAMQVLRRLAAVKLQG
jgi:LPS-assembly lipoprotein